MSFYDFVEPFVERGKGSGLGALGKRKMASPDSRKAVSPTRVQVLDVGCAAALPVSGLPIQSGLAKLPLLGRSNVSK